MTQDNNIEEEKKVEGETQEESPLATCEKERDEYLAGWQRAKADLINYQKEQDARLKQTVTYSTAQVIKEFLPAFDSLNFALESVKGDEKAEKGVSMIKSQFTDVMKKIGVTEIPVQEGDELDGSIHEAMMQVDTEDEALKGKVMEVIVPGYKINDHVIRPAKVKVGKA